MAQDDSFIRYSDFIVPDESVEKLIGLLESVGNTMDGIARKVPVSAKAMADAIKKVTGVTVDGEDALAELATFIDKLEKSYRDLAYAQSDFGKTAAIVKEQIKATNKETVDEYNKSKQLKGSIDALNTALKEYTDMYKSLSEAERTSKVGSDVAKEIRKLTSEFSRAQIELRAEVGAINDYVKAQVNLAKQQDYHAISTAKLTAETAKLAKQRKLGAAVMTTEETSLEGLKARIDELTNKYRGLTDVQRASSQGVALRDQITALTVEYEKYNAEINNAVLSANTMGTATRKLAQAQSDQAEQIAKLNIEAQQYTDLARAQAKLDIVQSDQALQLASVNVAIEEQNRQVELNARLKAANIPIDVEARKQVDLTSYSYNQLNLMFQANAELLKNMPYGEAREDLVGLQRNIAVVMETLKEGTSTSAASLNRLGKNFNGLSFSISQLVREAPAATVSFQTFLLAISNNLPNVAEQIRRVAEANKIARDEGKATVSVIKQVGRALVSFTSIVAILTTLLTFFGDDLLKLVKRLFESKNAIDSHNKALRRLRKELKDSTTGYGDALASLYKLRLEWRNLSNEADKTKWIKNNTSEFNKLGVAINSINDAENAFVRNSRAIQEALIVRARATAAEKLASEEFEKSLKAGATRATLEEELTNMAEQIRGTTRANYLAGINFEAPGAYVGRGQYVSGEEYQKLLQENIAIANQAAEDAVANNTKIKKQKKDIAKATEDQANYEKNAMQYVEMGQLFEQKRLDILKKYGFKPEDLRSTGRSSDSMRNIDEYIRTMYTTVIKRANTAAAKAYESGYEQQKAELEAKFDNEIAELTKINERNKAILANEGAYANVKLTEEQRTKILEAQALIEQALINTEIERNEKLEQLEIQHQIKTNKTVEDGLNLRLEVVKKGSEDEIKLLEDRLEAERKIALAENQLKPKEERVDPALINAQFNRQKLLLRGSKKLENFEEQQALKRAEFEQDLDRKTQVQITRFELTEERNMWLEKIALAEEGMLDWSDTQLKTAKQTVKNLNKELDKLPKGFGEALAAIGEYGPGGALLHALGFDNDQIEAVKNATDTILGFIGDLIKAEIDAAQKQVDLAKERVDAIKSYLEIELEARANGYANNVELARKELALEKENQAKKQKLLEQAQAKQEAIDTATQASSLTTASAQLWSVFSKAGFLGPALAAAAIAGMWTSFIAAKLKAKQITASQAYGEGGLEILEGGSHASGNDIDLGVNNHRHRRMRAEGGEALAIISKKRTRQYRDILPGIIDSLNKGTFEQSYVKAFDTPAELQIAGTSTNVDLSRLEGEVASIRAELDNKLYVDNGTVVVKKGNLTRIIRR